MSASTYIKPGQMVTVRYRIPKRYQWMTFSADSSRSPVWIMGVSSEGLNRFSRGELKPPSDNDPPSPEYDFELPAEVQELPPEGVLFSSPPTFAFAREFCIGDNIGHWYLLIGNRGQEGAVVNYDVWS